MRQTNYNFYNVLINLYAYVCISSKKFKIYHIRPWTNLIVIYTYKMLWLYMDSKTAETILMIFSGNIPVSKEGALWCLLAIGPTQYFFWLNNKKSASLSIFSATCTKSSGSLVIPTVFAEKSWKSNIMIVISIYVTL